MAVIMTLQILQVSLFAVPVIALAALGMVILLRPSAALNRRWLLLTFLPLLLANLVSIVMNDAQNEIATLSDWRFWVIVAVDLVLAVGIWVWLRGVALYGLPLAQAELLCKDALEARGYSVAARVGEKRTLLTMAPQATILTVTLADGEQEEIWFTSQAGEVIVRADSRQGMALLRRLLPPLRSHPVTYVFQEHVMGVLYLVLALVLLVFGWIYFFEPRLLLVE